MLADIKLAFSRVRRYIHSVISMIALHDFVEIYESLGVEVILEEGLFTDDKYAFTITM